MPRSFASSGTLFAATLLSLASLTAAAAAETSDREHPRRLSWTQDADLHRALRDQPTGRAIRMDDVPLPGTIGASLDLERFDVRTSDAIIYVVQPDGTPRTIEPDVVLLRGMHAGDPQSRVFLGIGPDALHGFVIDGAGNTILLSSGPHRLRAEEWADARPLTERTRVRRTDDLVRDLHAAAHPDAPLPQFVCGVHGANIARLRPPVDVHANAPRVPSNAEAIAHASGEPCRIIRVLIDTDRAFTDNLFGGDAYAASSYALLLMGAVSEIYRDQINVRMAVPLVRLFAGVDDPWQPADMFELLNQFRTYWQNNQAPVRWELAHLLAGQPLGGGVAWLNAVCSQQWGFGVSTGLAGSFPYPSIDHSHSNWDPFVVAHELGHNAGTLHTHDGYEPPIDNCGNGDCSQAYGGTIMSYCHTCAGGLSNIRLQFHPRVVQRISEYLATVPCDILLEGITARNDVARTWAGQSVLVDVLRNDQAYSCDDPVIESFDETSVLGGAIEFVPASAQWPRARLRYTAPPDATGNDTFLYTLVGGATAFVSIDLLPLRSPDAPANIAPGSFVSYYELSDPVQLPDFSTLTPYLDDVVPQVNFPSTNGNFATSGRADEVGAVFTGFVNVPVSGIWTLFIESDDGSRLYIGDEMVVDNDGLHGMVERSGEIGLLAGRHRIRIEFFERFGGAGLIARWSGPSTPKQVIPSQRWSHALPCEADLNGDGIVDVGDLLTLLATWGPCDGCAADLDGDGNVGLSDLLELLGSWGPC